VDRQPNTHGHVSSDHADERDFPIGDKNRRFVNPAWYPRGDHGDRCHETWLACALKRVPRKTEKPTDNVGFSVCMARPERFELPTTKFVAWCSIQLSYGRKS
jgi:hypothetical protein